MTRYIKSFVVLVALCLMAATSAPAFAQTQLATGKPTVFKVTVTKVELYNGTSYVTVFTGSSQLDLTAVAGATFPSISAVSLPAGTYTQIRVTFGNTFTIKGSLTSTGTTYYTTATTVSGSAGSLATTVGAAVAESTILNPSWGALGADVVQTIAISAVTVATGTAYAPTLKFDVTNGLVLSTQAGVFYFTLAPITVSIV